MNNKLLYWIISIPTLIITLGLYIFMLKYNEVTHSILYDILMLLGGCKLGEIIYKIINKIINKIEKQIIDNYESEKENNERS